MFLRRFEVGALFLIAFSFSFGWTFDFEVSISTSATLDGLRVSLKYEYLEIGRSSEGFLGIEIINDSSKTRELLSVEPEIFFTVPGSPLKLPLKIPPQGMISISAFLEPTDTVVKLLFDTGSLEFPLEISKEYERERREFFEKQLRMVLTLFVAVLMVFLIRGNLEE